MAAKSECIKSHAIMISLPYQGHINPFVSLALKLASNGFSVTFVHFEFVHQKLSKAIHSNNTEVDLFSEARESGLDIRYTTITDGFPSEFDRELHFEEYLESITFDLPSIIDEFVGKTIESDPYSVHFLVSDTIYAWSGKISDKYNLINVSLWTQPALLFSLGYHMELLREKGHFPWKAFFNVRQYSRGNKLRSRSSVNKHKRLDAVFYKSRVGIYSNQSLIRGIRQVKKADFILHNTVYELESQTLSALSKYQPNYAIGPIRFSKNVPTNDVSKSFWSESDCTNWLDSKSPGSVLYVSFGSSVQTNKQVTEEVAYGLLLSEVNFIWVIRPGILGSPDNNVLPFGFEDEINIKDKGLIIPWCDQIKVLSNPVIGGFLTHCGWNSTLESMWCGVPMICYPIDWDQPTNRKLVVDDWKIGINLCDYGTSVDRKQVAEKIKQLMSGNSSKSLRQEADNVKAILQKAVEIDGSSEKNFDRFIEDLRGKIHETA
ncbi:hypothetical protein ABFX02_10G095800 [Erythranthe guttata]